MFKTVEIKNVLILSKEDDSNHKDEELYKILINDKEYSLSSYDIFGTNPRSYGNIELNKLYDIDVFSYWAKNNGFE